MNDDFLTNFRQPPRPEFSAALYDRLMQEASPAPAHRPTARRLALAFALTFSLILTFSLALSPTLRAAAQSAVDSILAKIIVRGTTVLVTDDLVTPTLEAETESYSQLWTASSPQEIAASQPYFDKLPAWVPAEYTLQKRAALFYGSMYAETPSSAAYQWRDAQGRTIQLEVLHGDCPNGYDPDRPSDCDLAVYLVVNLESEPQVLSVNGHPAVFYKGAMGFYNLADPVRAWNPSRWKAAAHPEQGASLIWDADGRTFFLIVESDSISKEDLLRLAESIP